MLPRAWRPWWWRWAPGSRATSPRLADLVRPTIGVVTSIGSAHLEHLGGPEGVRREKGSLVEALPVTGYAILNDVDCGADVRRRTAATVVTFGTVSGDVRATVVALDEELRPTVRVDSPWGGGTATLSVRGEHQAANAAAAVATAVCAGVDFDAALAGVAAARGSSGRAELWRAPSGLRVLDDSYNANPTSTERRPAQPGPGRGIPAGRRAGGDGRAG